MHPRTPAVVLDACVLANQTVADLMLRLAEDPAMIHPRWSEEILAEVRRTIASSAGRMRWRKAGKRM